MTHLEMLERGLARVLAKNNGEESLYARDLKGQIAAAKFQQEQMLGSVKSEDRAQSSPSSTSTDSNSAPIGDMSDPKTAAKIQDRPV